MDDDADYKPERRSTRKPSVKKILSVDNACSGELISVIKEYRLLYDPMDASYTDSTKKDRAWHEIAMMIELPESQCRKMWSNLRDGFRRSFKKRKDANGQAVKPWKYDNEMAFLIPFMKANDKSDMFSFVAIDGMDDSDPLMSSDLELGSLEVQDVSSQGQTQFVSLDKPELETPEPQPDKRQKIQVHTEPVDKPETPGPLPEKRPKIQVLSKFKSPDKPESETPPGPTKNQVHTKPRSLDKPKFETPNRPPKRRQKVQVHAKFKAANIREVETPGPPPERRQKVQVPAKFRAANKPVETPTPPPEKRKIQEPLPEPSILVQPARVATPIVTTSINTSMNASLNKPMKTPSKSSTSSYEDIDLFFSCIAATVRQFSSLNLAMAKSRVFAIVSEMEMTEIAQNEQE